MFDMSGKVKEYYVISATWISDKEQRIANNKAFHELNKNEVWNLEFSHKEDALQQLEIMRNRYPDVKMSVSRCSPC